VGLGEIWKHGVCRVPLTYTPMFSSLAFLLGIYALASLRLSLAADFPPLRMLSLATAWLALAAWAASAAGWSSLLAQLPRERVIVPEHRSQGSGADRKGCKTGPSRQ
jgi:hypothetical protein